MNHLARLAQMGMPLANAAPAMTAMQPRTGSNVSLMPFPSAQMPQQANPMSQLSGQGMGLLGLAMQKQMADQNRGGPVPGIALPMDISNTIGSQIQNASFPPVVGLDPDGSFRGTIPSITGEMVPAQAGMSGFDLSKLLGGVRSWFGGWGG